MTPFEAHEARRNIRARAGLPPPPVLSHRMAVKAILCGIIIQMPSLATVEAAAREWRQRSTGRARQLALWR